MGPVTHEDCPQHGRSASALKLKEAYDEVTRYPLLEGPGPWTADEDENGVVLLKDGTGRIRAMMARSVYDELRKQSDV